MYTSLHVYIYIYIYRLTVLGVFAYFFTLRLERKPPTTTQMCKNPWKIAHFINIS